MNSVFFSPSQTSRKIRYAAVGAGWITQEDFLPGVEHTGNSKLTALVTSDPEKARELAKRYEIDITCGYDGYQSLLHSGKIDAIYLALPNSQHLDFALLALEAGIHVLCEKPMAVDERACLQLIEASKRSGAKLMIAYRLHFEPATLEALELVQSGKIGQLRFFSSIHVQQVEPTNHRLLARNWAGPLPDMGPYPINAVRQLFRAEPTEAFAYAVSGDDVRFREVPEMVSVQLRFPEARLAQFLVGYGANAINQYRVVGTEGDLELNPGYTWTEELVHHLTVGEKKTSKTFDKVDQFGGETKYFSDCILSGRHPEPDGWEGLADVRVIKAIEESLKTKRPVQVIHTPQPYRPEIDQKEALSSVRHGKLVNAQPAG